MTTHTSRGTLLSSLLLVTCIAACTEPQGAPTEVTPDQSAASPHDMAHDLVTAVDDAAPDLLARPDLSDASPDTPLTYYRDIKPIVAQRCEGCHTAGNIGPYALDTYAAFKDHAALAMASIDAGRMPPWSPDPSCRHFVDERLIPAEEVETLRAWIAQEMPEGDRADWLEPKAPPVHEPDLIGHQNLPYAPTATPVDDYQCYVIDLDFAQDTYITGTTVVPGNTQLVHHANLFLINPTHAPRLDALQDASPDAGYECFGDPGISQTNLVGAWVPGAQPIFLPEDSAIVIDKGSKLVLQVHYNTLYAAPEPVESQVHLFTRPEPPTRQIRAMPLANLTFEVPPGEKESVHTMTVRNSTMRDWLVIGTGPHLHLLAKSVKVEVLRKDDEPDLCLVDIPDWDFNWQQEYRFRDDEWVSVRPGDAVKLTCVFDNSPENQPVINGEQLPPQEVSWGGKTADEMCLNFLVVMQDYDPDLVHGPLCSEFKTCRQECDDPFGVGCIFNCAAVEQSCGECLVFGAQDCALRYCRSQLTPTIPCLLSCAQGAQGGGDIDACLTQECPAEYEELEGCMRPYIEQGLCNQYVESCNVQF